MTTLTLMNLLGVDPIPGVPNSPVPELLWGLYRRTEAAAGEPAGAALAAAVQPASMEPIHLPLGFLMARYPAMQVGADFFAEVVTIANGTVVMNQKPVGWYPNVLDGVLMEGDVYVLLVEHGPPDTIADDRVVYITKLQIGVPVTYIDFSDPVGYTMIYPAPPGGIPSEILGAWPRDPWDPSIPEELRPDPDPDDPNDPNNPTDPGNPGDPGDPDDPGDPGDPTDPDPEPGITEDFIEKRWEEFLDAVDWIPGAHHFLRGLSLGVNFAQLLNAIFEGDRDEVVDEISDLVEDIVSFVSWPFSAVVDDIAEPLIEAFANRLLTMFGWPRV